MTQEVFLRLVKILSRYRPTGKFSNYVFTIAVNAANDYFRKNKLFIHEELNSIDIDAGINIEGILISDWKRKFTLLNKYRLVKAQV